MELQEIVIKLTASLGTPLKGDTLFGHFCWQAAHDPDLLDGGLDHWLGQYHTRPFAVFSSAWPCFDHPDGKIYAVKRPDLPNEYFNWSPAQSEATALDRNKALKKHKWLLLDHDLIVDLSRPRLATDHDLSAMARRQAGSEIDRTTRRSGETGFLVNQQRTHNTINRLTQTTGSGPFAPYVQDTFSYFPETRLAIFVLIDPEALDGARLRQGLANIGRFGFGRDASTGLGRYQVLEAGPRAIPRSAEAKALYTLGPCLPEQGRYARTFFTPFVRFGRHGDLLARTRNPFKNPVLMADEGAVLVPALGQALTKPYLGRAVSDVSLAEKNAVTQAYAPYLPLKLEATHEPRP